MKLKLRIFALMAMLLCFSTSTFAQVAKINDVEYTTFSDAVTAANAMTGDVTVEVYGEVEFVDGMELKGNYTSICFVGKEDAAKITINQTAGGDYLEAHGKNVSFTDLTLTKANPAWAGNSGHMGNYFSIQGGTVNYTNCTFPNGACTSGGVATYTNCTFQNTSEYGLWVYDDALVTVSGGIINSTKGIKVYSEDEATVTSTLTVKNATFTENVTAKPAVAVGYAESITLIDNTYNNATAHVELDSGSDADCEGITFVAQDAEGNDIASALKMTDRSNSQAACGVLVDSKIYTTATEAAKVATEGSNVTLLYTTTETVEFAEGVNLTLAEGVTAENVTVKLSGPVEVADFASLKVAVEAGKSVKLTADITTTAAIVTSGVTSTIDLNGKTLTIGAGDNKFNDKSNITIENGAISITDVTVSGNAIFCLDEYETSLVTTLTLNNVHLVGDGYSSAYGVFYIGKSSVLNVNGGVWNLANDTHASGGVFKADASTATLNIDGLKLTAHNIRRGVTYAATTIENSTIEFSGDADEVDTEMEHGFNRSPLAISNSTITMTDMVGRGITAENGAVTISDNSAVTMTNCQEATIDIRNNQTVTISDNSTVTLDAEPTITSGTINGTVNVPAPTVAKIGDVEYVTLADAVAAVEDGGTIVMVADETFTMDNHYNLNAYREGLYYEGDKSFTIDLGGFTIAQDGSLNDYLLLFKNAASKSNTITLKNGTIDAGTTAYCAICTSSASTQQITVNTENVKVIGNNSNGSVIKVRGGTVLNVNNGTEITGKDSYLAIENATSVVNIYDGVKIYMNGTSSYNGCLVGVGNNGTVNVYGGYGKGVKGAFIAMTSGGTINVAGGEWMANTDGTAANDSKAVLIAQNDTNAYSSAGKSIINVTGGTFKGGYNCYATTAGNAQLNIKGGKFNTKPADYLVDGYAALTDLDGNYVVGAKPTATVNNLGATTVEAGEYMVYGNGDNTAEMPLSFVMQFLADQTEEDMAASPYADWYGDFVITFTGLEDGSFTADGCYLAGHYGSFGWVKVPVDGMAIEEGARYPVMLGVGMGQKYDYICSSVQDFRCALYLTPEVLEANPNIKVNLELAVVDNSKGDEAAAEALVNNEIYSVTDYTYNAEDFVVNESYIAELTIDDAEGLDYTNDTDKTVGILTYKRTLIEGIWNPLYLPFDIELTDELLENYEFADYNQMISIDSDGDRVPDDFEMELFIYTGGVLNANYPYFIRPKNAEACALEIVQEDATLYAVKEISLVTSSVKNTFKLSGTYKAMGASDLEGSYAISTDGDWAFTESLKPHRLYFTITDNNGSAVVSKAIRMVVRGEGGLEGTTAIENVEAESTVGDVIYDFSGRRVFEPEKGGIYIVNGKKVIF